MADASAPTPRMNVGPSGSLAGGVGIASVIAFFWNWYAVSIWGAPKMELETAGAVALVFTPVVHYVVGWLPMPPARNRRVEQ